MSLTDIIKRKLNEAKLNPGRASTPIELSGGLRIAIRENNYFGYKVYLSRAGLKPPSEKEIETILENWPGKNKIAYDYEIIIAFKINAQE